MPDLTSSKKLAITTSAILFIVYVVFSYFVAKETFTTFDFNTTVKFQDHISRRFDYPFSIFSVLGSAEVIATLCVVLLGIFALKRYFWTFAGLFLLPLALTTEIISKYTLYHPAPPHLFYRGVIQVHFPSELVTSDYSYPSGHVLRTTFLITLFAMWAFYRLPKKFHLPIQAVLVGYLGIMLISRVYLGEHWTTDVIGGFLVGSSTGLLAGSTIPVRKA